MFEKTLFGKDKKGGYKVWTIQVEQVFCDNPEAMITISHGKEGGKMTIKTESITVGKQGRTVFEQGVSEAEGRIKKQVDKGYRESKEELEELPLLAMLASDYNKVGHRIKFPCYTSVKYDGVRAMAFKKDGKVRIESRTGQVFSIPHLEEALCEIMQNGQCLDGEIYKHGYELQDILSAVKRTEPDKEIKKAEKKHRHSYSAAGLQQNGPEYEGECEQAVIDARRIKRIRENLEFHIFDIPSDQPFEIRLALMYELYRQYRNVPFIFFTHYDGCVSVDQLKRQHKLAVKDGFEGLMIRNQSGMYESGKRSGDLQKYKTFLDEEFEVLDVVEDKQGDGVFVLRNNLNKETFQCVMGSHAERKYYLQHKYEFIGKWLKVKFQSRFKGTLLPQFPTGVVVREGYAVNGSFIPYD